jgi:DNA-binding response OmpR family regulator/HPt (histidine-containing phosphotransfer) domain-containing protein
VTTPAQFNEAIAKLREKFAATAGNTIQAFSALADQLQRMPTAPEVVEALRRELHRIHGTAGSYGFHEVSRLAAALELVASRWQADPLRDRDRRAGIVRHFSRSLEAAFRGPSDGAQSSFTHRVLLVDIDDDLAAQLVAEGVHRGHAMERATLGNLEPILDQYLPEVVICAGRELPPLPEGVPIVMLGHLEGASSAGRVRILDPGADASEVMRIAESLAAQTGLAGASLYVVDDDPSMLEMLRVVGEAEGMFVRTAGSADGLIEELVADPPAMLLLDAQMPGVDGVAATRRVREDRRFADLPILMVSSSTDPALRASAFAAGADDFQSKPVVTLELSRRIARLLEVRRQRQIARGIHPATSLWLPERTIRVFDEALTLAAQEGRAISLALLRPRNAPGGMQGAALWHREATIVSGALAVDGVRCGFADETALAALLPMGADDAMARLESFAEASEGEPIAWCAGVVEQSVDAERSARTLVHLAEEAWQMARDSGERLHRWDTADSGIAPDVVVVEDDPALADLLGYALASRGLTHQVYRKGPEALAGLLSLKVHERRPVVLMDIDLPGLDGFSLFERLRIERPRDFRVVFISVHASEGDQLRALRAGALDYIVKPVSLRVLMAKIAVWRDQDERT